MKIENLSMSFGTQSIFGNVSFEINNYEKVGIVGVNGAGKSTLFNLILGLLTPDSGKVIIKETNNVGYLPQVIEINPEEDQTVLEYLLKGRPIAKLKKELEDLYLKVSTKSDEQIINKLYNKINKVEEKLEYYEEYTAESTLLKIISGMGIESSLLDLNLSNLSGGQKSKIAFAKLLYSKPNIMLLDEPTNHLDLEAKEYIINYLKSYSGIVLVISHDIEFLDRVTNKTIYINKISKNIEIFSGNYTKYLKVKKERELAQRKIYEEQIKEEEKLQTIINKYLHGNEKKANIAKDRIKKLEKLQKDKVVLEKKNKYVKFNININRQSYLMPISCKNIKFGYDENNLLYNNLSFDLNRGEKLLIVGENGIGKTTLLKLIMSKLKPLCGEIIINNKTDLAYYAQEHEILDNSKNIIENLREFGLSEYTLRNILGSFLFYGDDVYKKVKVLSPGEKSRVALAKVSLSGANTLLLDEPTNHLDPMTQSIIADTFKEYTGTMLLVSHNLDFVDNLNINRILLLPSGKIVDYKRDIVLYYEMLEKEK